MTPCRGTARGAEHGQLTPATLRSEELHPVLDEAVTGQLALMSHVMFGGLTHEPRVWLAQRLASMTPAPSSAGDRQRLGCPGMVTAVTDRSGSTTGPGRSRTAWAEVTWPPAPQLGPGLSAE